MMGSLHADEIADVLSRHHVGHLACIADERPYVVPLTYAYHDGAVYGQSFPGRKIRALRTRPAACFEVEDRSSPVRWRSVVAEGVYEELTDSADKATARELLAGIVPVANPGGGGIFFRIRLTATSGRWLETERPLWPAPAPPLGGVDLRAGDDRNWPVEGASPRTPTA
jgi:uncharacterized protein